MVLEEKFKAEKIYAETLKHYLNDVVLVDVNQIRSFLGRYDKSITAEALIYIEKMVKDILMRGVVRASVNGVKRLRSEDL